MKQENKKLYKTLDQYRTRRSPTFPHHDPHAVPVYLPHTYDDRLFHAATRAFTPSRTKNKVYSHKKCKPNLHQYPWLWYVSTTEQSNTRSQRTYRKNTDHNEYHRPRTESHGGNCADADTLTEPDERNIAYDSKNNGDHDSEGSIDHDSEQHIVLKSEGDIHYRSNNF